jgi:hypothetical protein
LASLGIAAGDPRAKVFDKLADDDLTRLWDLANEGDFGNAEIRKQAAAWALSKSPGSAREFVANFQLYAAEVNHRTSAIVNDFQAKVRAEVTKLSAPGASVDPVAVTKQLAKTELGREVSSDSSVRKAAREKALREMAAPRPATGGSGTTVGAEAADEVLQTNLDAQTGAYAPGTVSTAGPYIGDVAARIKSNADALSFRDANDAAYHAHKHALDMAVTPPPAQEMVIYLNAARATIKNGTAEAPNAAQLTKGQSISFVSAAGDRCIVFVDAQGNASIATFLPAK